MSGYIGTQPVPQATQTRDSFTAAVSQTSFATAGYAPGYLDVYLNGVKLAASDYTATNGSDVVLTVGAALNDLVDIVAFSTFELVSQTFYGTVTATAFAGSGSALTSLPSANLTGALPAIDGSALTSLTAANLTGALPAIDGSALTGITTTAQVGTATAGLAVGAVGSYALLEQTTINTARAAGDTLAGASLIYANAGGNVSGGSPSGTWRIMGAISIGSAGATNTSVWLRIS